jgi:LmbE family N-acetylglucosaminyl deacetylase
MQNESSLQPFDEDWDRALCVVAHPDDVEFGLASVVARWTAQGKEVSYLLMTRGEAGIDTMAPEEAAVVREHEQMRSARVVGVTCVEFLDYRDGVIEYGPALRRDIARAIRRHRPEVVLTNSPHLAFGPGLLNSADHRAVGLATLDAAYDAANRWIFPELLAEGLEPWAGVRMIGSGPPVHPTHGLDVTDYFELGVASLREHAAYLEALGMHGDPGEFLRLFMEPAGARMGCELAIPMDVIFGPGMSPEALRQRAVERAGAR